MLLPKKYCNFLIMKLLIMLFVAIAAHQTYISGLSFSQIVKLFHESSDIELEELKSAIEFMLKTFEDMVQTLADEIDEQCDGYLSESLQQLEQLLHITNPTIPIFKERYEMLSNKIGNCHDEVDNAVNEANEKYIEILKKGDVFVSGLQFDDADDTYENYFYFKNQFESIIIPTLADFLTEFRYNSIFLPLKLKLCIQSFLQRVSLDIMVILYADVLNIAELDNSDVHNVMENATHHVLELINEIENKSSSYMQVGLSKVKQLPSFDATLENFYDLIVTKINDCANKSDGVIDGAKTNFFKMIMESLALQEHINFEENSIELLVVYRQKYDIRIPITLINFLNQLRYDSILVPSAVKRCVEEVVYLSTYAAR